MKFKEFLYYHTLSKNFMYINSLRDRIKGKLQALHFFKKME